MITKTMDQIRSELIAAFLERLPNLDLTDGTPERDMFIESPIAGQLYTLWDAIVYISKTFAPILYYNDLNPDDVKTYMANYNVTITPATKSSGSVTFYTYTKPLTDIIIIDGTIVRTDSSTPIEFSVDGTYTMYSAIASSYYNPTLNRWEISCNVKAVLSGPNYRAGANTIIKISSDITGIEGCTNPNAVTGGQPEESLASALRRVVEKFQGRGLASTQGIKSYVNAYVTAVNVVGAEDPEMLRDEGLGGAIDIYVIGNDAANYTDSITITSAGLSSPFTVNYTSTGIKTVKQPLISIISVIRNGTVLPTTYYSLVSDTGLLKNSTRSSDKIVLTTTGITSSGYFTHGDSVEINYLYNGLLSTIESDLNSTTNHYENRDYLMRGMTEVTVNVAFRFKETSGQNFDDVSTQVALDVSTFIDSILNSGSVERADIISVAKSNPYVDNIDLSSVVLTPVGGGTLTSQGDIELGKNEYPMAGTMTLTRWAS